MALYKCVLPVHPGFPLGLPLHPGFHGATKVVNWVLGLLLIHHVITNNGRLTAALQAEGVHESADIEARRAQIKSALSRGSEE